MKYRALFAALCVALAFGAAACGGGGGGSDNSANGNTDVSGSLSMMAIWAGEERRRSRP
jgi:ABC-type glycerol-3-phosphate transport system substrate-binding protein